MFITSMKQEKLIASDGYHDFLKNRQRWREKGDLKGKTFQAGQLDWQLSPRVPKRNSAKGREK
jgi:hypothetical protein